jgi:hypothetical protein
MPIISGVGKSSNSEDQGRLDDLLVEGFTVSEKMLPYVNRIRLRAGEFKPTDQPRVSHKDHCREDMRTILGKKNISGRDAEKIIDETLDVAAYHQLQWQRRDQDIQEFEGSKKNLQFLIKHINHLLRAIPKLSPLSNGNLNKIIVQQDWRNFDTEMFSEFMHAMQDALSRLSPARVAKEARSAIHESLGSAKDFAVAQIPRTAPPAIVQFWETIPEETRAQVEAEIRCWTPPKRGQVIKLLTDLVSLLKTYRPIAKRGRRPAINHSYLLKVAKIWCRHGLDPRFGPTWQADTREEKGKHIESQFQRFARLALTSFGDESEISVRQIRNLKSTWRRNGNRGSMLLI